MPRLTPVDFDPFADEPAPKLTPVDFNPFPDDPLSEGEAQVRARMDRLEGTIFTTKILGRQGTPKFAETRRAPDGTLWQFTGKNPKIAADWTRIEDEASHLSRIAGEYRDKVPLMQRIRDDFGIGYGLVEQAGNAVKGATLAGELDTLNRGGEPFALGDPYPGFDRMTLAERAKAAGVLTDSLGTVAEDIAQQHAVMSELPRTPVTAAVGEAETFTDALGRAMQDPTGTIGGFGLQSAVISAPALALGPLGPAVAALGIGASSGGLEGVLGFLENIQGGLLDPEDPKALLMALTDPKNLRLAQAAGLKRGAIIGLIDALTAGIAAKTIGPNRAVLNAAGQPVLDKAGKPVMKAAMPVLDGVAQMLIQMAGGAGGEAAAQVAEHGRVTKPGEVFAEGAGELFTAPAEILSIRSGLKKPPTTTPPAPPPTGGQEPPDVSALIGEPVGPNSTSMQPIPETLPVTDANSPAVRGEAAELLPEDVELVPAPSQAPLEAEAEALRLAMREAPPASNVEVSEKDWPVEVVDVPQPAERPVEPERPATDIDVRELAVEDIALAPAPMARLLPPPARTGVYQVDANGQARELSRTEIEALTPEQRTGETVRLPAAFLQGLDLRSDTTRAAQPASIVPIPNAPADAGRALPIPNANEPAEIVPLAQEAANVAATPVASDPLKALVDRYKPGNPFAEKAARSRLKYQRLAEPSARDKAMAQAFPLGTGYGRNGGEARIEQTINRAVEAGIARKDAEHYEAQAAAFDAGEINAQGRRIDTASRIRSDKREAAQESREARIAAAKEQRRGKEQWQVPGPVWADSAGYFGGSGRSLILAEHREAVERALAEGKPVPADVLAEYPDLARSEDELTPTEAAAADRKADSRIKRAEKARARYQQEARLDPKTDDVLAAVAKLGGISREDAQAQGIDPADFKRTGWKIKRVFTKDGMSFDGMAEALDQYGYPVQRDGRYDANEMLALVSRALMGDRIGSQKGVPTREEEAYADAALAQQLDGDPFAFTDDELADILEETTDELSEEDQRSLDAIAGRDEEGGTEETEGPAPEAEAGRAAGSAGPASAEESQGLVDVLKERGQWELVDYEERVNRIPDTNALGNDITRKLVDWDRAEISAGSGKQIGYIYWLKSKRTGETQPFGRETAHLAMGVSEARAETIAREAMERKTAERNSAKYWTDAAEKNGQVTPNLAARRWREANKNAPGAATILTKDGKFYASSLDSTIQHLKNAGWRENSGDQADGAWRDRYEPDGTPKDITTYTAEDLADRERQKTEAEQRRQAEDRKAEADQQRDSFTLTGSNRVADEAAARGQQDLLSTPLAPQFQTADDETYLAGDKARYTGKTETVAGKQFYEVEMLEGHEKGKLKVTANAPKQSSAIPAGLIRSLESELDAADAASPAAEKALAKARAALDEAKGATDTEAAAKALDRGAEALLSRWPESAETFEAVAEELRPKQPTERLEDAGENLYYNRRNFTTGGVQWSDIKGLNDTLKVKEAVKARVWPKPDYEQLVADGVPALIARMVKQVYDGIATAPSAKTDEALERYIGTVQKVREALSAWASDREAQHAFLNVMADAAHKRLDRASGTVALSSLAGGKADMQALRDALLQRVWPDEMGKPRAERWRRGGDATAEAQAIGGNRVFKALQFTLDDVVAAMKDLAAGWPTPQEAWQRQGFQVVPSSQTIVAEGTTYRDRNAPVPAWRVLSNSKWSGQQVGVEHETKEAAEAAKAALKPFLLLDKRNRVVSEHDTEDAAKEAARAQVSRGSRRDDLRGMNVADAVREGDPRRAADEHVTSQRLMDTFGFRGVNFGREGWINQAERQVYLDHAYDALQDLAELMGVPAKALSLNGTLGIAFGAQGRGGAAAAHFVPGVNEINLTKTMGAGTLAHEWGHALDHYFATQGGLSRTREPFLSETDRTVEGIRPEVRDAFRAVVQAMNRRPLTAEEAKVRIEANRARAEKQLSEWAASIRTRLADKGDVLSRFDALLERVKRGDLGEGYVKSGNKQYPQVVAEIRELTKEAAGRYLPADEFQGFDNAASHMAFILDEKRQANRHEPQTVPTAYAAESSAKDRDRKKPYWSTPREMFARAFESWVGSRLVDREASNTFLSDALIRAEMRDPEGGYAMPYPRASERDAINTAFDTLVGAIETRETDKGVGMFARRTFEPDANDDPVTAAVKVLAAEDGMFQYPVVESKLLEDIVAAVAPDWSVRTEFGDIQIISMDDSWAWLFEPGDGTVHVNVGALEPGTGGSAIYHIAANYAYNNGLVFAGDPQGLTDMAIIRRTENMLSSALKFGTTRHLRPATEQNLPWREGDDNLNLRTLVRASARNMGRTFPEFSDLRYNFDTRKVESASDGQPLTRDDFERIAAATASRDARAGRATITRAALYHTLLSPDGRDVWNGVLAQARGQPGWFSREGHLAKAFYARQGASSRGAGLTVEQARTYLESKIGKRAVERLIDSGKFRIAESTDATLPAAVRGAIRDGGWIGGYTDGETSWIIADNLNDTGATFDGRTDDAYAIFLHEVGVHYGMRTILGDKLFSEVIAEVKNAKGELGEAAARARATAESAFKADEREEHAAEIDEEVLAWIITDAANHDLPLVKRILAKIRAWLISQGFTKAVSMDALVELARGAAMRAGGRRMNTGQFAAAWHGSPHDFERFKTASIGTGEGAQAYGWGLYFAGKKEVAEYYRDSTSTTQWFLNGRPLNNRSEIIDKGNHRLALALMDIRNADVANIDETLRKEIESLRSQAKFAGAVYGDVMASMYESKADLLEQHIGRITASRGRLYQVELAPKEDAYLYWDKPLSEQSETVKAALRKSSLAPDESVWPQWTGQHLYESEVTAATDFDGVPKGGARQYMSQHLRAAGIPGIKYLDQGSRLDGDGTYNYVIFDDADVEVTGKFARRAAEEAAAAVDTQTETAQKTLKARARAAVDYIDSKTKPLASLADRTGYLKERYLTLGRIAKSQQAARKVYDLFRKLDEQQGQAVYAYLTDAEGTTDAITDPVMKREATIAKQTIETIGLALVERGVIPQEAFDKYQGRYLPRVYLAYLLGDKAVSAVGAGKKLSQMGYAKHRDETLPQEYRDVIQGEIKDPAFLASRAMGIPLRDLAIMSWLTRIAENPDWSLPKQTVEWTMPGFEKPRKVTPFWLKSEASKLRERAEHYAGQHKADALKVAADMDATADAALREAGINAGEIPDGYAQIPNSARYGAIRGLVVKREIYDDIVGVGRILSDDAGMAEKILGYGGIGTKITQIFKWSKVAANPPAQVRNLVSNWVLMNLSGVPLHRLPGLLVRALREIRTKGKYYQIGVKYGITESTFAAQELMRIEREITDLELRRKGRFSLVQLKDMAAKVMEVTGDAYQGAEMWSKLAKIMDAMEREGKSESDAALAAQDWLFDYSLVGRNTRYLRNAPIGAPFLTFTVKVLPRLLEVALTAPWRFLPYAALFYGAGLLVQSLTGADDDDLDALKKSLPDFLREKGHAFILPLKDEHGRWQFVDLGYFMPWSWWTELATKLGKTGKDLATTGETPHLGELMTANGLLGGPITSLIAAITTGHDPFTEKEIAPDELLAGEKFEAWMTYLYGMAMPTWLVGIPPFHDHSTYRGAAGHLYEALFDVTDRYGDPRSTTGQALARFAGVNVYPVEPAVNRERTMLYKKYRIAEVKAMMTRTLKDQSLSEADRKELGQRYIVKIQRMQKELQEFNKGTQIAPELESYGKDAPVNRLPSRLPVTP